MPRSSRRLGPGSAARCWCARPAAAVSGPITAIQILSEPVDFRPVAFPLDGSVSSAVIGGHDHGRRSAIVGHGLHGLPECSQVTVGVVGSVQIVVVPARRGRTHRFRPGRCRALAAAVV